MFVLEGTPFGANSVTIYPPGTNGNVPPSATITGPKTGLVNPGGIAFDSNRNIWLANQNATVTEYPRGVSGDAAPSTIISGAPYILGPSIGGLASMNGLALDRGGKIFTTNALPDTGLGVVNIFPAGSNANVNPTAEISGNLTLLVAAGPIGVNRFGDIYVGEVYHNEVLEYASGSSGNVLPKAVIDGSNTGVGGPAGIAFDSKGRIYVTNNTGSSITIYSGGAAATYHPSSLSAAAARALCRIPRESLWMPRATFMSRVGMTAALI